MKYRQLSKEEKRDVRKAVLLMRYRTEGPTRRPRVYMSYRDIARVAGITYNQAQHLARYIPRVMKFTKVKRKLYKLSPQQLAWVVAKETLREQAGFTLQERCHAFTHKFHFKRISVSGLRRIYAAHHIKRKIVR